MLLKTVGTLLEEKLLFVNNIDATIIAQAPRMAPYIGEMKQHISGTLGISEDQINIKATTQEGLGFTGRGEGIAAQAIVSIADIDTINYEALPSCNGCRGCRMKEQ